MVCNHQTNFTRGIKSTSTDCNEPWCVLIPPVRCVCSLTCSGPCRCPRHTLFSNLVWVCASVKQTGASDPAHHPSGQISPMFVISGRWLAACSTRSFSEWTKLHCPSRDPRRRLLICHVYVLSCQIMSWQSCYHCALHHRTIYHQKCKSFEHQSHLYNIVKQIKSLTVKGKKPV